MDHHLKMAYLYLNFVPLQDQLPVVVGRLPSLQDHSLDLFLFIFLPCYLLSLNFNLFSDHLLIGLSEVLFEIVFDEYKGNHEVIPWMVAYIVFTKEVFHPLIEKVVLDDLVIRLAVVLITNTAIIYHIGRVLLDHHLRIQRAFISFSRSNPRFPVFLFFFDCLNFQNLISQNLILFLNSLFLFNTFKDSTSVCLR